MTQLHEILAVEGDREGNAKRIMMEARNTFGNKPNLFTGSLKHTEMLDSDAANVPDEHVAMVTTVEEKLNYVSATVGKYFDVGFRKDAANQEAKGDIIIDGNTLISDCPVTWLLGMETKLKELRKVIESIPTLAPSIYWEGDPGHEKGGVFRTKFPTERFKTAKEIKHKVLYDATDHHPAQIETWNEMVNVGRITETTWSGMISPADKSLYIGRMDKLIQAVKKARQRANTTKVGKAEVGPTIFNYLFS